MCAAAMLSSCVDPKIDDEMNIDGSVSSQVLAHKPKMVFSAEQAISGEILVKFRESNIDAVENAVSLTAVDGVIESGIESIVCFPMQVVSRLVSVRLVCICGTRLPSMRAFRCRR